MTSHRFLLLFLSLAFFAGTANAQTQEPQTTPAEQKHKQLIWEDGKPCCDSFVVDGVSIRIIKNDGIIVALYMNDTGGNYVAEVRVINNTERRILVDPAQTLFAYSPKKSDQLKFLDPIPPEKIAGKIKSSAKWGNFFRALGSGMATQQSTSQSNTTGTASVYGSGGYSNGTYNETTTTTRTAPDREAQRRAAEENARNSDEASMRAAAVMDSALKANTVFPGKAVGGQIYFERKKYEVGAFRIVIEDTFYDFVFTPPAKK